MHFMNPEESLRKEVDKPNEVDEADSIEKPNI